MYALVYVLVLALASYGAHWATRFSQPTNQSTDDGEESR